MLDDTFEVFMLTDELESSAWPNAFDRVEIIAAEENAEVNKLCNH